MAAGIGATADGAGTVPIEPRRLPRPGPLHPLEFALRALVLPHGLLDPLTRLANPDLGLVERLSGAITALLRILELPMSALRSAPGFRLGLARSLQPLLALTLDSGVGF